MGSPATHKAAPTSNPTLGKVGADMRWLLEKSGIDPESALVTITVHDDASKDRLISTFAAEFDQSQMFRDEQFPDIVVVHGIRMIVVMVPKKLFGPKKK